MLENADESMFAERQEALFTFLVLALDGPILQRWLIPKVCAIALGTDTRVIYENKTDEILVLPQVEQNIHILVRDSVFLNAPERMRDQDISDIHGRVSLGNFYFVADVPPHSSVPVISMWRCTNEVSESGY